MKERDACYTKGREADLTPHLLTSLLRFLLSGILLRMRPKFFSFVVCCVCPTFTLMAQLSSLILSSSLSSWYTFSVGIISSRWVEISFCSFVSCSVSWHLILPQFLLQTFPWWVVREMKSLFTRLDWFSYSSAWSSRKHSWNCLYVCMSSRRMWLKYEPLSCLRKTG